MSITRGLDLGLDPRIHPLCLATAAQMPILDKTLPRNASCPRRLHPESRGGRQHKGNADHRAYTRSFMIRRREFVFLLGTSAVAWPVTACAQQRTPPTIGYLHPGSTQ